VHWSFGNETTPAAPARFTFFPPHETLRRDVYQSFGGRDMADYQEERHVEPHCIEAHEASIVLCTLVEGLRSEADTLEILWDIAFTKLGAFEIRLS
jgi:hypothetical protein